MPKHVDARRIGVGGSCGSSVENRWIAQLDLGDGEPLDNLHGAAAVRTRPEGRADVQVSHDLGLVALAITPTIDLGLVRAMLLETGNQV